MPIIKIKWSLFTFYPQTQSINYCINLNSNYRKKFSRIVDQDHRILVAPKEKWLTWGWVIRKRKDTMRRIICWYPLNASGKCDRSFHFNTFSLLPRYNCPWCVWVFVRLFVRELCYFVKSGAQNNIFCDLLNIHRNNQILNPNHFDYVFVVFPSC